ncbi:MAG: hypothetical protein NC541_01375 [bacterium]|nr:hypothetical protein [bacterium]
MKKRGLVLVLAAMLLTAGCGNSEKVIPGDVNNSSAGTGQQDGNESGNPGGGGSSAANQTAGYYFVTPNGVTVQIDAPAAPVIEAIGGSPAYFESTSCAFEGLDKIYTYNSYEIDTYPQDGEDYISAVIFKDDSVATPEGVAIGDSRSKMEETYGTDSAEENGKVVYAKDGMKLCFILQGDSIVSVEYLTTVLD